MSVRLDVQRVTKHFLVRAGFFQRRAGVVHAVDEVNLRIDATGTLGIVGESGCGKSTLARVLVGLLEPTSGQVSAGGQAVHTLRGAARRQFCRDVQLIFQDPANSLNPRMRVETAVAEPLIIHRLASGQALQRRVDALLEQVRLPLMLRRRLPRELSGGERQRVGIARALATEPKLLICDEPIASLDVSVGSQILKLLNELHQSRHVGLVFISHDLAAVASLCQRIAVMYLGRVVEEAPTAQLVAHPWHPYTELLLRASTLDLNLRASGERPSNIHPPSGCRFRTRCPIVAPVCQEDPPLLEKQPARLVACHKRP